MVTKTKFSSSGLFFGRLAYFFGQDLAAVYTVYYFTCELYNQAEGVWK